MDIEEVLKKRNELNRKIFDALSPLLAKFNQETGLSINHIDFVFEIVTTYQDLTPQYMLTKVRTDVDL